jgi:hypothetical protein
MERLINPAIDGGLPYINQDFFNVLQNNNLSSYKSFLETINDTKNIGNNGIIVKGVRNVTPIGQTTTLNFDFTNSMIYLNGDFLEPKPTLALENNIQILGTKFYLVRYEIYEKREKKVSGFIDDVIIKTYFDFSTDEPSSNESYIEIEIKNNKNYCSRYLDRILRYYLAHFSQLYMTFKTDYFSSSSGKGFGEMFGFQVSGSSAQGKQLDTRGKFLIGYSKFSQELPETLGDYTTQVWFPTDTNYKKLQNEGGGFKIKLSTENLPPHNHGGLTNKANNQLRHNHEVQYGSWNNFQPAQPGIRFARTKKIPSTNPNTYKLLLNFKDLFLFSANLPTFNSWEAFKNQNTNLWSHLPSDPSPNGAPNPPITPGIQRGFADEMDIHTHPLPPHVGGQEHTNEPPYAYVIYYEKIDPYV